MRRKEREEEEEEGEGGGREGGAGECRRESANKKPDRYKNISL